MRADDPVHSYHDGTKHHFNRFARSLGYLDWASQPDPFRHFDGAAAFALPPRPDAPPALSRIGTLLRYALALSAWKRAHTSRWSLRVNPSSGNLHPTEAYVVLNSGVYHYDADLHALAQRCACDVPLPDGTILVALTSIHWREAWKYGERAFRYCQHDLGHAIAAVRIAAALDGSTARLLPEWSHEAIAALTGIDRDEDYVEAEREEPGCLIAVNRPPHQPYLPYAPHLVEAIRTGRWTGRASQLSEEHVQWTFIDEIAAATRDPGRSSSLPLPPAPPLSPLPLAPPLPPAPRALYPAPLLVQRRSALALDGHSAIDADRFLAMLARVMPAAPPFDAMWWDARIHLALFVHRVTGLDPGLYFLPRSERVLPRFKEAARREFTWTPVTAPHAEVPLFRLVTGDCRRLAERVSCDQEIAADGFFSLGMIADFDDSLEQFGASFYRHLFWESGIVGQVLYLEAEAAGARATGIGCFYDDPVHEVLGLTGHAFQSLYHFTVGIPVEDARLTSERAYAWER